MKKRFIPTLLCFCLLFGTTVFASEEEQIQEQQNNNIDSLILERAETISEGKLNEIPQIDKELEQNGVRFISTEEAVTKYFSSNNSEQNRDLTMASSSSVEWLEYSTEYSYAGKVYVVDTLIGQDPVGNSNLCDTGSVVLSTKRNATVGGLNLLVVLGKAGVSQLSKPAELVVTVFDSIKAFVSGINPTTKINNAKITYSYNSLTTASYKYVREKGDPVVARGMTFVSTMNVTSIGYMYPSINLEGFNVSPNVIQGKYKMHTIPYDYNNHLRAIEQYRRDMGAFKEVFVSEIDITGIDNQKITTLSPAAPRFPSMIY